MDRQHGGESMIDWLFWLWFLAGMVIIELHLIEQKWKQTFVVFRSDWMYWSFHPVWFLGLMYIAGAPVLLGIGLMFLYRVLQDAGYMLVATYATRNNPLGKVTSYWNQTWMPVYWIGHRYRVPKYYFLDGALGVIITSAAIYTGF